MERRFLRVGALRERRAAPLASFGVWPFGPRDSSLGTTPRCDSTRLRWQQPATKGSLEVQPKKSVNKKEKVAPPASTCSNAQPVPLSD